MESSLEVDDALNCKAIKESARVAPNTKLIAKACDLLLSAKEPVILAGGGVNHSDASESLIAFAQLTGIPIATTNKGRGSIPEDHPLCLGPMGQYGTPFADRVVKKADVLLALGCRFSDVATRVWSLVSPGTKIIHVDIDPKELGRQFEEELSMVGDVDLFLQAAVHEVNSKGGGKAGQTPAEKNPRIAALIQERQAERDAHFAASAHANVPGKPQLFVKEIIDLLKRDAIVALGAGLYARYAGRVPILTPRSYLKSLGLGALGWAFPAALGAKLGRPSSQVVALMGDADFLTVMQDLHTAVRENIAVAVVIFNDCGHGSIRELQKREYEGRVIGSDYPPPSFHEYARIAGAQGVRITKPEEVKPALGRILDSGKPGILEVFIPPYPA